MSEPMRHILIAGAGYIFVSPGDILNVRANNNKMRSECHEEIIRECVNAGE